MPLKQVDALYMSMDLISSSGTKMHRMRQSHRRSLFFEYRIFSTTTTGGVSAIRAQSFIVTLANSHQSSRCPAWLRS
jgi:hypothetical protein